MSAPDSYTSETTKIAALFGGALLIAGLVLVAVVLPAEYAVDPLGIGSKLGLLRLGEVGNQVDALESSSTGAASTAIVVDEGRPFQQETISFTLKPHESVEYKYRLEKGKVLLYSWSATAAVNSEFHAEPDGAPAGYAQTYEKHSARTSAAGTLTAPLSGIHGWYWENTSDREAVVTLTSAGFYALSHEFHTGEPVKNKTFK